MILEHFNTHLSYDTTVSLHTRTHTRTHTHSHTHTHCHRHTRLFTLQAACSVLFTRCIIILKWFVVALFTVCVWDLEAVQLIKTTLNYKAVEMAEVASSNV